MQLVKSIAVALASSGLMSGSRVIKILVHRRCGMMCDSHESGTDLPVSGVTPRKSDTRRIAPAGSVANQNPSPGRVCGPC
jgi:hypothetical protein